MKCNEMTCFRLYKYAKETREAQKAYFRTRDINDLRTAKALERELDKAIDTYAREVLQKEGGLVEAARRETRGNAAAMHEALKRIVAASIVAKNANAPEWILQRMADIFAMATTALAAPSRNCDMPFVVDGPADNNADKAWRVFRHHNPDAYFDVPGLLRCIDWLLSTVTNKEGGAK